MPVRIACPKCHQQYQVAESAIGKPVSCKKCGTKFKAAAPATSATVASGVDQPAYQQASASALASFGVDGPLAPPPQIFTDQLPNGMLRNQFEDPGFGDPGSKATAAEEDVPGVDKAMASIVNNPYAKSREKKQSPLADIDDRDRDSGSGKRKTHPAVKDSLDQATMTLLLVGVLIMGLFGFLFFTAEKDARALVNNMANGVDEDEELSEEERAEMATAIASGVKIVYGVGMGVGMVFIGLAFGVQVFPLTCSIIALIFYVALEVGYVLVNWFSLFSIGAWIRRVVVCGAIGKAIKDTFNARLYAKMMRERAKR